MPLADFACPTCARIEPDVLIPFGHAVAVDCLDCKIGMVRRIGLPQPAIFSSGGTGASRGT